MFVAKEDGREGAFEAHSLLLFGLLLWCIFRVLSVIISRFNNLVM